MAGNDLVFWASQPPSVFRTIVVRPHECSRLMSFLLDPESPSRSVYDYVVALKDRFHDRSLKLQKTPKLYGFDAFERIALESGVVRTLFQIARDTRKTMERVFTSYFAAEALWNLITLGNKAERRQLMQEYLEVHDVYKFCLEASTNAFFVCHRAIAMMGWRVLTAHCFLKEFLSVEQTSEVMKALCNCLLAGPKLWTDQMKDPATTWQSMYCFGSPGSPTSKARKYAPRYYSMYQENAAWTIIEFGFRYPVPDQQFFNDILKKDPELIDLLLKCANIPRRPWYPQLEVDTRIMEALVLFINFTAEMVPGVEVHVENRDIQDRLTTRWNRILEGANLIAARPSWSRMLVDIWERLTKESADDLHEWLIMANANYFATEPYDDSQLLEVATYRGHTKNTLLRLVTTMAFCADIENSNVKDSDLLNLLPVGRSGCRPKILEDDEIPRSGSLKNMAEAIAQEASAFDKPGRSDPTLVNGDEEEILQIDDELVTGPTCYIRLLVSLAKRGLFQKIQQWDGNTLPEGVIISGGLEKLKKLTSDEDVEWCLRLAVDRVSERREIANKTFRDEKELDEARFKYWSAAQLAAALVEFDEVTNGKHHGSLVGARKELALNLGNAAEMALGKGYCDRALVFASESVRLAEKLDGEEAVATSVIEKNRRRVDRAREGIQQDKH